MIRRAGRRPCFGNWSLAVGASRLRGRRRYSGSIFGAGPSYSADTYQEATGATLAELDGAQGAVTRRLPGPLLRSLSVEALYGTVQRITRDKNGRPYATPAVNVPAGDERFRILLCSDFDTLIEPLAAGTHLLAVGDWSIFDGGHTPQLRLFSAEAVRRTPLASRLLDHR